jgi:hypothetical protein
MIPPRLARGDVYQAFLYAFAYAHPGAGSPSSLILYPATSSSAGFRLAIQTPAVYAALESPVYPLTSRERSNDDTTPAAPRTGRCCLLSMTTHSPP